MGLFGNSGNFGIDTSVPEDPYAGQRPERRGGIFGKLGVNNIGDGLGLLADIALFGPAAGIYRDARKRNSEDQAANNAYKRALMDRQLRPNRRAIGVEGGGIAMVDEDAGTLDMLREPTPVERVDPIIARLEGAGIDPRSPQGQQMIRESLPGYGYSPEVFKRKTELKAAPPGKAPGSGGGGGGVPTGYVLE